MLLACLLACHAGFVLVFGQRPEDVQAFLRKMLVVMVNEVDTLALEELSAIIKTAKKSKREVKKVRPADVVDIVAPAHALVVMAV